MTDLFNFGLALSVLNAPPKVRDEITDRMLARFAKGRAKHISAAARSYQEVSDEMLQNFDAEQARAINGSRT